MKRAALIFCILLFFLYSCQRKKGESVFIPSTELQPLTLGMLPTLDGLPFHIAKAQGIYDSLGLDLTILLSIPPMTATQRSSSNQWMA